MASPALAQAQAPPPAVAIASLYDEAIARDPRPLGEDEVRPVVFNLAGPRGNDTREVVVWRPPGAQGVLPVLYMMDGFSGLTLVAHQIAPSIAQGESSPIMIVATEPHPYQRTREYVPPYRRRNAYFPRHRDWFISRIVPWAEQMMGASRDRLQRGIGGVSNGGDFAVAVATHRPDLFGLVLVHAPMNPRDDWVLPASSTQRWVVSGGTRDSDGEVARELDRQLGRYGAYRRICIGPWEHVVQPWRDLSAGSTMWLFGYTDAAERISSQRERAHCVSLLE
jgi:dienelactone hydrolase